MEKNMADKQREKTEIGREELIQGGKVIRRRRNQAFFPQPGKRSRDISLYIFLSRN
jgi:hypothetical protein